jgi:hypothetical protein
MVKGSAMNKKLRRLGLVFTVVMVALLAYALIRSARQNQVDRLSARLVDYCAVGGNSVDDCADWVIVPLAYKLSEVQKCANSTALDDSAFAACMVNAGIEP